MDGMTESESNQAVLVARAPAPTIRSSNSGLLEEFAIQSSTCPSKLDTKLTS